MPEPETVGRRSAMVEANAGISSTDLSFSKACVIMLGTARDNSSKIIFASCPQLAG
jgi:hypothetical protein